MTDTQAPVTVERSRVPRGLLIVIILILLLALVGLLYVLWAVTRAPESRAIETKPPGLELVFQAYTGAFGQMQQPFDVAYHDGLIYVTLPDQRMVVTFDDKGKDGQLFAKGDMKGGKPLGTYTLIAPMGVDVDTDGTVYVADNQKMAVVVFSPTGEKLREIPVMSPRQVKVKDGKLYIVSSLGSLFVMDTEGNELGRWGTAGRGPDQLADANGVTVDDDGNIYICDMDNYRVIALSPDLKVKWRYGAPAKTEVEQKARKLDSPTGITIGADGNLYLVETLASHVKVLNKKGEVVSDPLGTFGNADDQFAFPVGIELIDEDVFVVADRFHDRILGVRLTPTDWE